MSEPLQNHTNSNFLTLNMSMISILVFGYISKRFSYSFWRHSLFTLVQSSSSDQCFASPLNIIDDEGGLDKGDGWILSEGKFEHYGFILLILICYPNQDKHPLGGILKLKIGQIWGITNPSVFNLALTQTALSTVKTNSAK